MDSPKWKPRPKSFPEATGSGYVSAADLNNFNDTQDIKLLNTPRRAESYTAATNSPSATDTNLNSKFRKARNSIFVTKEHIQAHRLNASDDEESDEAKDVLSEEEMIALKDKPVLRQRPLSNLRESSTGSKKNRNSVRFSMSPEKSTYTNTNFIDDDGNKPFAEQMFAIDADVSRQISMDKPNLTDPHWQQNGSEDEDDDMFDDDLKQLNRRDWDSFQSIPIEDVDHSLSSEWSKFFLKLFKLFSYGITFLLVLFFGVTSKLSMHLIASMTKVNKTVVNCNRLLPMEDHDKHYHSWQGLNSPQRFAWLWVLFFVTITPDVLILIRSLKVCLFKQYHAPDGWCIFAMFITHSIEVIGISLFTLVILPSIDIISGLMFTNCLFLLPSFCLLISHRKTQTTENGDAAENANSRTSPQNSMKEHEKRAIWLYSIAFGVQFFAILAWPLLLYLRDRNHHESVPGKFTPRDETNLLWIMIISGVFISFGYWENFTTEKYNNLVFMQTLSKIKRLPIVSKYAVYLYISVWKCLLYLMMMVLVQGFFGLYYGESWQAAGETISQLFTDFATAFQVQKIDLVRENTHKIVLHTEANGWPPVIIGLIQVVSSFVCYQSVVFVCKICIQPFSFALPINLILPVSISLMNFFVNVYGNQFQTSPFDICFFSEVYQPFEYIFWNVHYNIFNLGQAWNWPILILWFVTFVSQVIAINHIWISSKERLSSMDRLFVLPYYASPILEQSIMLNRRLDEDLFTSVINKEQSDQNKRTSFPEETDNVSIQSGLSGIDSSNAAKKIRIFACATVWHETSDELVQMLKSIMRMDEDQAKRRIAVKYLEVDESKVDYYEFETHLFVDDAFVFGKAMTENDRHINQYVQLLISVLNEAAENVHQRVIEIKPPRIFVTPYGGRLEWRLPGGTKLIAHLKDKLKIRHRKRWSQVMYMYYLLGYKIYEKENDPEIRKTMTDNTYILALDGDINFRPEAVLLLVDLMRKNKSLGAACGRVHPVGTGPMAWYQIFEYAISHWLQKATEHVFGCVLCSPGCFSLFRATALVDINVMNRYTTKPTEAIHYVQYDQGEDRWLCTLMLQQGWRVEYSAASDSFTHCPEGFGEFYIQRRRWAPSTMANIIDLLGSYKHTVKKNDHISSLYMLYQASIMLGTILSPGTIFLMLVGAVNTAFNLRTETSFYINFFPILAFVLVCFLCKTEIQLLVAQIWSTFYAMLMLAVLISTAIEIKQETIFSPTVIFFVGMLTVFVIAAFVHPQEFFCLLPLFIYMLLIPSMYLLLTIYSIINLNIVTWGTRETPSTQQQAQAPVAAAAAQITPKKDFNFLTEFGSYLQKSARWSFNVACCTSARDVGEEVYFFRDIRDSIGKINNDMSDIKSKIETQTEIARADLSLNRRKSILALKRNVSFNIAETEPLLENDEINESDDEDVIEALEVLNKSSYDEKSENETQQLFSTDVPSWINDEGLCDAKIIALKKEEKDFWIEFIEKYLKPLDNDKAHQKKVKEDLIDLRNKAVFGFGIINIIFVLFVFLLQMKKDLFSIKFYMNPRLNGTTIDPDTDEEKPVIVYTNVNMDPIGLVLIIFFGTILLIQFIGMFMHRFGTITHLLAFTDVNFFKITKENVKDQKILDKNAVEIVNYYIKKPERKADEVNRQFNMENHFFHHFNTKIHTEDIGKNLRLSPDRRKSFKITLTKKIQIARRKSLISTQLLNFRRLSRTNPALFQSDYYIEPEVPIEIDNLSQTSEDAGHFSQSYMNSDADPRTLSENITYEAIRHAMDLVNSERQQNQIRTAPEVNIGQIDSSITSNIENHFDPSSSQKSFDQNILQNDPAILNSVTQTHL